MWKIEIKLIFPEIMLDSVFVNLFVFTLASWVFNPSEKTSQGSGKADVAVGEAIRVTKATEVVLIFEDQIRIYCGFNDYILQQKKLIIIA